MKPRRWKFSWKVASAGMIFIMSEYNISGFFIRVIEIKPKASLHFNRGQELSFGFSYPQRTGLPGNFHDVECG